MERVIVSGTALAALVLVVPHEERFTDAWRSDIALARTGLVVLAVTALLAATAILHSRPPWLYYGVLVGASLGVGVVRSYNFHLLVPTMALAGLVVALRVTGRRAGLATATLWLGGYLWGVWPGESLGAVISELTLAATGGLTVGVLVYGARRLAVIMDHDDLAQRVVDARLVAQKGEEEGRRHARLLVHDHVLHALIAISFERSVIPASRARLEALSALSTIQATLNRRAQVPGSLRAVLEGVRHSSGVKATVTGSASELPPDVMEALALSTREALVNADRHAHASVVGVSIRAISRGVMVVISDNGTGFDLDTVDPHRLGVRGSLFERMASVGGIAAIETGEGRGTQVSLTWREPEPVPQGTWGNLPPQTERLLLRVAAWALAPTALAVLTLGWNYYPTLQHPTLGVLATLLALLTYLVEVLPTYRARPTVVATAVLAVIGCGLPIVNAVAIGDSNVGPMSMWLPLGTVIVLTLPVLLVPKRQAVLLVLLGSAAGVFSVLLLVPPREAWSAATSLTTTPATLTMVLTVRWLLVHAADGHRREAVRLARAERAVERSRRAGAELSRALDPRHSPVIPFLHQVAAKEVEIDQPQARQTASDVERELRSQLALWNWPALLEHTRGLGSSVALEIRCHDDAPEAAANLACRLLDSIESVLKHPSAVASSAGKTVVTLSVRPHRPAPKCDDDVWIAVAVIHPVDDGFCAQLVRATNELPLDIFQDSGVVRASGIIRNGDASHTRFQGTL